MNPSRAVTEIGLHVALATTSPEELFHVWLVLPERQWQPRDAHEVPAYSKLYQLAEPDWFTRRHASLYVETFNERMLHDRKRLWAVLMSLQAESLNKVRPGMSIAMAQLSRVKTD